MGKTLAEKIWNDHIVRQKEGEPDLLFIDLHLIHEVTSPQAFDGLRLSNRSVHRPDLTLATEDHNVPTLDIDKPIADPVSKLQVDTLRKNCQEFGVRIHSLGDVEQGIVHVVGPQLGLTQPGMTIVCGDSHTSTHGAFGALEFGIGTSEVEHVLATQTLPLKPFKTMAINIEGSLKEGVTAKDIILVWAGTTGKLDSVPVADIRRFEAELLDYIGREHKDVFNVISETRELSDDTVSKLEKIVETFKGQFK